MAQIKRAADIVDSTLRLSMPKERKELPLNLNDIINDALKIYQPLGVNLTKELSPLPTLLGDYEDLKLMFVNLLKNAGEAIRDRGEIKITTYSIKENGAAYVRADIADNGEGIPKENLERIFEPFFSTHVTRGRGLGLSIVFRIVREHLGNITVKSEVGKGTVFTLTLPAKE
jgi:two-component system NtrC family sensor kinase